MWISIFKIFNFGEVYRRDRSEIMFYNLILNTVIPLIFVSIKDIRHYISDILDSNELRQQLMHVLFSCSKARFLFCNETKL